MFPPNLAFFPQCPLAKSPLQLEFYLVFICLTLSLVCFIFVRHLSIATKGTILILYLVYVTGTF
jgi:hypothetical protein